MRTRLRIRVYGIVQGVGFRPFVSRIAARHGISGSVSNRGSYVEIFASGEEEAVTAFLGALEEEAPARSVILKIKTWPLRESPDAPDAGFTITESEKDAGMVYVSPDIATCPDCEQELFDPEDPRYLHPFINCTACGPRLTILDSMPYDRIRTSMGEFPMCPRCGSEYTDMASRRYHAQPVCCPDCGPTLYLIGTGETGGAAILRARAIIRGGGIVAVKGIGGFHLCCDAENEQAVQRLRTLKTRPAKPFAVMMRDMETVRRECLVLPGEEEILTGPQKPILLLERNRSSGRACLAESVAPGNPNVGVMLPYAPVQMLLFRYPPDPEPFPDCLVMTSGNPSGAPIAMDDDEAIRYLAPLSDAILSNNRKIRIRADDTVMAFYDGKPYMIRRSRGYAPLPVIRKEEIPHTVLGIGGELKNTFCLAGGDLCYLSPYVGDMADPRSLLALDAAERRLCRLLELSPEAVACDLHPGYHTREAAEEIAERLGAEVHPVQHHYAHIASCLAENEYEGPVIGVSFDGTGYGTDGSIWGGEFLAADLAGFERLGSAEPFLHAGGDLASKEGFRIALSILLGSTPGKAAPPEPPSGLPEDFLSRLALGTERDRAAVRFMTGNGINVAKSTSTGRIFDAVSAILGIRSLNTFEGEMSMALEFAAERAEREDAEVPAYGGLLIYPEVDESFREGQGFRIGTTALVRWVAEMRYRYLAEHGLVNGAGREDENQRVLALAFHRALSDMIDAGCRMAEERTGIRTAALSGGVFQNLLLLRLSEERLQKSGFRVLRHSLVPPNDGGIALGQAVVLMERLYKEGKQQEA